MPWKKTTETSEVFLLERGKSSEQDYVLIEAYTRKWAHKVTGISVILNTTETAAIELVSRLGFTRNPQTATTAHGQRYMFNLHLTASNFERFEGIMSALRQHFGIPITDVEISAMFIILVNDLATATSDQNELNLIMSKFKSKLNEKAGVVVQNMEEVPNKLATLLFSMTESLVKSPAEDDKSKPGGSINGIWLTTPGGVLHPAILPNLSSWVAPAASERFEVVLWTNLDQITPSEVAALRAKQINVRDHKDCSSSPLYKYFLYFLDLGIQGDRTAFAFASDILRMAILQIAPDNEFYIYVDANDITLQKPELFLRVMRNIKHPLNGFGFAFFIELEEGNNVSWRNDVLIALKQLNPNFFSDYLRAYEQHLRISHKTYVKPSSNSIAQTQAMNISCSISGKFFKALTFNYKAMVQASFGAYIELVSNLNSDTFLPHERRRGDAHTWFPDLELDRKQLKQQEQARGPRPEVDKEFAGLTGLKGAFKPAARGPRPEVDKEFAGLTGLKGAFKTVTRGPSF